MVNTYLAVHSADDLQKKMKELESAWGHFVSEKQKPNSVRQKIYQSWRRCQKYKVDPLQKQAPIIIDDDYSLKESITKSKVYTASRPVIDSLNNQIKGTGHLITLADHQGRSYI